MGIFKCHLFLSDLYCQKVKPRCIFHTHVFTYNIVSYPKKYSYSISKRFPSFTFFSYNEEKTSFSKFQKSSHFHSDITSIWSMYFINKQPKFWKKINSLSYSIWNSISEGTWLFHDSKGLTHTFCMWYSRTGMCMYSVV